MFVELDGIFRNADRQRKVINCLFYLLAEDQFPKSAVDPPVKLASDLAKVSNLGHAKLFVEFNTRLVRQRNTGDHRVKILVTQLFKKFLIQCLPDSLSRVLRLDIKRPRPNADKPPVPHTDAQTRTRRVRYLSPLRGTDTRRR